MDAFAAGRIPAETLHGSSQKRVERIGFGFGSWYLLLAFHIAHITNFLLTFVLV